MVRWVCYWLAVTLSFSVLSIVHFHYIALWVNHEPLGIPGEMRISKEGFVIFSFLLVCGGGVLGIIACGLAAFLSWAVAWVRQHVHP